MSFRFAVPELDAEQGADFTPRHLSSLIRDVEVASASDAAVLLNLYLGNANRSPAKTDDRLRALIPLRS